LGVEHTATHDHGQVTGTGYQKQGEILTNQSRVLHPVVESLLLVRDDDVW